jgi:4-aminobutyrate aminotransferase/(S)-3-amino-2-methylpropionate transaminase
MSMTSKIKPYKFGFGPFAPEIYRLPYPDEYRSDPKALSEHLENFFSSHVAAENVACVVLELVLGEGGFLVAPREYVRNLEKLSRRHGILLVIDEVQTGFGRTGRMFACEHYDVQPDLTVLAKSLAGGFPLSAVTGRAEIMDSAQVGGLGGTFTGNPVSCAAALAVIDFMEKQELVKRAEEIGVQVDKKFRQLYQKYSFIGDTRGLGAMRALEIVKDRESKTPDKERTNEIARRCYENGLILLTAGTYGNVLRTLMPLVITDDQLKEGLDVIEYALQ